MWFSCRGRTYSHSSRWAATLWCESVEHELSLAHAPWFLGNRKGNSECPADKSRLWHPSSETRHCSPNAIASAVSSSDSPVKEVTESSIDWPLGGEALISQSDHLPPERGTACFNCTGTGSGWPATASWGRQKTLPIASAAACQLSTVSQKRERQDAWLAHAGQNSLPPLQRAAANQHNRQFWVASSRHWCKIHVRKMTDNMFSLLDIFLARAQSPNQQQGPDTAALQTWGQAPI